MGDAYSWLAMHFGYPLYDLARGRHVMQRYKELLANEELSRDDLSELQAAAVIGLVKHARESSPYYRQLLAGHGSVDHPADLIRLPILRKSDIQTNLRQIISDRFPLAKLTAGRSGGSTGEPTHFFHDARALDYLRAATLRSLRWTGYAVASKVVKVSGSHFDHDLSKRLSVSIASRLLRQRWLSAMELNEPQMDARLEELRRWQPEFFWGYASAIDTIAQHLLRTGRTLPLRAVITSSDNLTMSMRASISAAFESPVFNAYSSRELSVGWECERHEGFHINSDISFVEVVDDEDRPVEPGRVGRLLVTDMVNYGFPFIRYDIGDRGSLAAGPCPCGRPFPLLASLDGRSDDFIVRPDGTKISPPGFTVLMSDFGALRDYRFVQGPDYRVTVELVVRRDLEPAEVEHLHHGLSSIFSRTVPYEVRFVDKIDYGTSGKRRVIVSHIAARGTRSDESAPDVAQTTSG